MNDDRVEAELRAWLVSHTEHRVPASLEMFLLDLPHARPALDPVRPRTLISIQPPRRELALALVAAAVIIAVGAGLLGGFGRRPSASPSASSTAQATNRSSSAPSAAGPITVAPWAGDFFPTTLSAADPTHLVVVGATGDGVGSAVVAVSNDAGRGWYVRRLSTPALLDVAAAGSSILATTDCSEATANCNGLLLMSPDGGASWAQGTATGLRHPTLLDQKHGWAASESDLLRPSTEFSTVDGGQTWTSGAPPCGSATAGIFSVEFATPAVGWAACVGDSGAGVEAKELLGTVNGGTSWSVLALATPQEDAVQQVGSIPGRGHLLGVSMLADGHGWLWTDDALYASSDGGRTWATVGWGNRDTPVSVSSAALVGDDNGFALVRDDVQAHLIHTTDGGRSWTELVAWSIVVNPPVGPSPGTPPETIGDAGFANGMVGWAMTDHRLRLTSDGGVTWRTAGPPVDYGSGAPKGVSFFDADHGWVVSEDTFTSSLSLWRTADGGAAWTRTTLPAVPIDPGTMGQATTVWIDATHAVIDVAGGMANGYLDGLLITADGGATWTEPAMRSASVDAGGITGDVSFLNPKVGWLAGGAPGTRLWATRDGGQTWTLQTLAVPSGYLDDQGSFVSAPRFFTATLGVVARTFANNTSTVLVIYQTSDGGLTWRPVNGPTPLAASWSFPSIGSWILWDPPTIWRSSDQGLSWTKSVSNGLPGAPVMTDDLHGWAMSTNGSTSILYPASSLYVTSDGGSTWTSVDPLASLPPTCQASALEVRGGRMGGGTGTAHADLFFTNVGSTPCSLSGQPKTVEFLTANGIPLALTPTGPQPDPVPPATLAPGVRDAASVAYNWSNWCGKAPGPLRVRVELPEGGSVTGPFDGPPEGTFVPRCDNPSGGSALELLWGFASQTP